jgi:hypothetical protein
VSEESEQDTFYNEDPAPAAVSSKTIHESDTVSQKASERTGDSGGNEEVGGTESELLLCVEEREVD